MPPASGRPASPARCRQTPNSPLKRSARHRFRSGRQRADFCRPCLVHQIISFRLLSFQDSYSELTHRLTKHSHNAPDLPSKLMKTKYKIKSNNHLIFASCNQLLTIIFSDLLKKPLKTSTSLLSAPHSRPWQFF